MKKIVITGASKGIGKGLAREFLKKGCQVMICGRSQSRLDECFSQLKSEMQEYNKSNHSSSLDFPSFEKQFLIHQADIMDISQLTSFAETAVKQMGQIDIWVNNAGRNQSQQYLDKLNPEEIFSTINLNLTAMINGCAIAIRIMKKQAEGGVIYNMEGLGSNNMIFPGTIIYSTTKKGLTFFTKGLRKELKGTQVRAGLLSPGMVFTDLLLTDSDKGPDSISLILGDFVETVTPFLVKGMLNNKSKTPVVMWLTQRKTFYRFFTAGLRKKRKELERFKKK